MDKQLLERDDSTIGDMAYSSPTPAPIIFCINPDDPMMKRIKAGQQVTYDLVQGDNGQYYAINIELAHEEVRPERHDRTARK